MKKILLYLNAFALSVTGLTSCADDYEEYDNSWLLDNDETMTLEVSSTEVSLVENTPIDEPVLTFTWTPAREMSDDYILTYVTMLDLKINEFGSTTVKRTVLDDGVYSCSYTTEELQSYIVDDWGQSVSEVATLTFKVIAKWEGGSKFIMPETRTVDVEVLPYKPAVFDADVVYVSGSAKTGISRQMIDKTLENEYLYAEIVNLKPGELTIPVEYDGYIQYISPDVDNVTFNDGEAVPAKMIAEAESGIAPEGAGWVIPESGDYRVVIDMLNKNVTIYSPDNEFNNPFVLTWIPNGPNSVLTVPIVTEVTNLWLRGDTAGWKAEGVDLHLIQSKADPQILVYSGDAISSGDGRTSFAVISSYVYDGNNDGEDETYNVNNAAVFAPPRVNPDEDGEQSAGNDYTQELTVGAWMPMSVGSDLRGNYWKCNKGTNFIVFDLRNMRIKFETK